MIILFNPRATRPRNRRLPLAVLALAAVLEGQEEYEIVDGNLDDEPITSSSISSTNMMSSCSASQSCPGPRWLRRWKPLVKSAACVHT